MREFPGRLLAGLALAIILGGCSDQGAAPETTRSAPKAERTTVQKSTAGLPACANSGARVELPAAFPEEFPLPPGAVITSREKRSGDRIIIKGVAPAGFKQTLAFFQTKLPEAGFKPTDGEVEPDRQDAESSYESREYLGRWKITGVPDCEGATSLTVLALSR